MKLKFWGVRGSIPTPISNLEYENKVKKILNLFLESGTNDKKNIDDFYKKLPYYLGHNYGGNTPCLSVEDEDMLLILDCGSGIKDLGSYIMNRRKDIKEYHIFLTHVHWDHILGLPFFVPIFLPDKFL
jgi:phosphoribosyl 1,2-cyclic phosphodiesterase